MQNEKITISIKGFDNTEKECIGYVSMPIEVGGKTIHLKFYVFQGKFSYNVLLGR